MPELEINYLLFYCLLTLACEGHGVGPGGGGGGDQSDEGTDTHVLYVYFNPSTWYRVRYLILPPCAYFFTTVHFRLQPFWLTTFMKIIFDTCS